MSSQILIPFQMSVEISSQSPANHTLHNTEAIKAALLEIRPDFKKEDEEGLHNSRLGLVVQYFSDNGVYPENIKLHAEEIGEYLDRLRWLDSQSPGTDLKNERLSRYKAEIHRRLEAALGGFEETGIMTRGFERWIINLDEEAINLIAKTVQCEPETLTPRVMMQAAHNQDDLGKHLLELFGEELTRRVNA